MDLIRAAAEALNDITEQLLEDVNVFDRESFKAVIGEMKGDDQESHEFVTLLYQRFAQLYHLSNEEREEWLTSIEAIDDTRRRVGFTRQYYSQMIKDSPDSKTYLKYLTFVVDYGDRYSKHDNASILAEFEMYFDLFGTDFQGSSAISKLFLSQLHDAQDRKKHYLSRLRVKHQQLDETFEEYSKFISDYFEDSYEKEMKNASKIYNATKKEQYDWELQYVISSQKTTTEYWLELLDFIVSVPKKKRDIKQLRAVFENAISEVNDFEIWKKFLLLSYEHGTGAYITNFNVFLLRFIKAFPYSPYAYTEYLRNVSIDFASYETIEKRLQYLLNLEVDFEDWKELVTAQLKVLFENSKIPDDSLIQSYLKKAFGTADNTFHTVERFVASLFEKAGEIDKARSVFRQITSTYPTEAENWLIAYNFEKSHGDITSVIRVLKAAINRSDQLDWPERVFEEALRYSSLYGDDYRFFASKIEKKKLELWTLRSQHLSSGIKGSADEVVQDYKAEPSKRRLEPELDDKDDKNDDEQSKKRKTKQTRDREHLTIAVQNIPQHISEKQIMNFFKDCGDIQEITVRTTGETNQANLEFTKNDDVLKALTKDYKKLAGNELRVTRLLKSTVWVTNFPPSYTQEKLEQLFTPAGNIISIRFPSLKFNSQRRFCYIEFTTSEAATKAVEELSGRELEGYQLTVKISDPSAKQSRSGATEEGREVYVTKLDFHKVTAHEVNQLFSKYGNVENVHLPLSKKNREQGKKHDGYGFVIFSTPEEAQAAVLELNLVSFEGRVIEVSISKKKSERTQKKESKALKDYNNCESAIALKGLDDTISAERLRGFFSAAGEVEDVILEPAHRGAIIVFTEPKDAGNASLVLEGARIGEYTVDITTVKDLKRQTAEAKPAVNRQLVPSNVRRAPNFLPRTAFSSTTSKAGLVNISTADGTNSRESATEKSIPKSNADFRALLLGKK